MNGKWIVGAYIALSGAMVAAQAAQDPARRSESMAQPGPTTTVSGCIERVLSANPIGSIDDRFLIVGATSASVGAAGTAGGGQAAFGATYELEGTVSQILAHLGHRVEIVGHLMPVTSEPSGRPAGTSGSTATLHFHVNSIRTIADTCTTTPVTGTAR